MLKPERLQGGRKCSRQIGGGAVGLDGWRNMAAEYGGDVKVEGRRVQLEEAL